MVKTNAWGVALFTYLFMLIYVMPQVFIYAYLCHVYSLICLSPLFYFFYWRNITFQCLVCLRKIQIKHSALIYFKTMQSRTTDEKKKLVQYLHIILSARRFFFPN